MKTSLQDDTRRHVTRLAGEIGPRNIYHYEGLQAAAAYCETSLRTLGYAPAMQELTARGKSFANISAERRGTDRPDEIVLIGAHYDTHKSSPGASYNASAVAALLALAADAAGRRPLRTLRFVAFTNEESPF